ncbi:MAG: nucleolar zinc-finger protein [Cirrosporium novae-zelandiae]|nr:MAG: nucleolar zinc-finger protein [Cirrosporium novae-zelandiae]KAI9735521.1 MAG: nucleolar zinc-finger protein [Cirrosporium novae-zelandiae]
MGWTIEMATKASTSKATSSKMSERPFNNKLFQDLGIKVQELEVSDGSDAKTNNSEVPEVGEEIESMCMNCEENGTTRMLLIKIPFFREVVIMSFSCPHCGEMNNEIQSAGEIGQKGIKYTLTIESEEDLERQLVKADTCNFCIQDLEIEQPAGRGKGQISTVEGALVKVLKDLESDQPRRKIQHPDLYEGIRDLTRKLMRMMQGIDMPFIVTMDDPAGNSWIGPIPTGKGGGKLLREEYNRTTKQNAELGLGNYDEGTTQDAVVPRLGDDADSGLEDVNILEGQVYELPGECPGCQRPCTNNMQMVNIPHFQQVIIMATVCDHCGYRTNEIKTGGRVPDKGRRITLDVQSPEDLSRDLLKSSDCTLRVPEIELNVQPGTLGGRFSTVEGVLTEVRDQLKGQIFDIGDDDYENDTRFKSDSMPEDLKQTWTTFFKKLDQLIKAEIKYTLILEDPLAGSFVQGNPSPAEDPQIIIEDYERSEEEDEELGLQDMNTENYQEKTITGGYVDENPQATETKIDRELNGAN